ncbi:unnamed protein product [Mytilus coruscus]|uniref:WSC domain-containing protein n=1 Tax=Mytilus coruscus TaxID=42192 RepID=A0A6J8A152_MYTCO|nr:unnamed protein product [Mytilus coruscus]
MVKIDCKVVYECCNFEYSWDHSFPENDKVTNIWCENLCKASAANYQYSGTIKNICYCHATKPTFIDSTQLYSCTNNFLCPGISGELCGGYYKNNWTKRITVSKIDRATEIVTVKNTQATSATFVSIRNSTTSVFMDMITSDTSPAIVTQSTPYTVPALSSTTSENAITAISTIITETQTQTTRGIEHIDTNGEWSSWKFCEVNCVREDTTEGIQRRWRQCNGEKCSGTDIEERPCSKPGICKGMRPRKLLCKCPKRLINTKWHFLDGKNITNSEVKKIVLEDINKNVKSEITVDKKTVSKEVRTKTSSVNKRKSAQFIGWGCIVFLILPIVFLIAIDLLNCCIHFRTHLGRGKRNRIRAISNIQDQSDSLKPLQENVSITEKYYASRCGNNFHLDEIK